MLLTRSDAGRGRVANLPSVPPKTLQMWFYWIWRETKIYEILYNDCIKFNNKMQSIK